MCGYIYIREKGFIFACKERTKGKGKRRREETIRERGRAKVGFLFFLPCVCWNSKGIKWLKIKITSSSLLLFPSC